MKLFTHNRLVISSEEMNGFSYIKEVWSGVPTSSVFRKLISESLEIYKKQVNLLKKDRKTFVLLADVTQLELISAKDISWLTDIVNPQYEALGFTHQAVIVPKSQMASKTVANYKGETESGNFDTQLFIDDLSARRWIMSVIKK